jgi:hypothetical protein
MATAPATHLLPPDTDRTEADAVAWMRALVGPVWRRAWQGEADGRDEALLLFERAVSAAYAAGGHARQLALLAGGWLHLVLDRDPTGLAWQLDELLPAPLGPTLRELLDRRDRGLPALRALWQPVRFARVRSELDHQTRIQPTLRASPGPEILQEARQDAWALLEAARNPANPPPRALDVLVKDPEEWAGEHRGPHFLLRGVKVWNSLHRELVRYQELARELVDAWTDEPLPAAILDDALLETARALYPPDPDLSAVFVFDLGLDHAQLPPVLQPRATLDALSVSARQWTVHDKVSALAIAREALAAAERLPEPAWVVEASAELRRLRDDAQALRARASQRLAATHDADARAQLQEVVEFLNEAIGLLDQGQSRQAAEWVGVARTTLDEALNDAALADQEARAATRFARLQAARRLPPEVSAAPVADTEGFEEALRALDGAWERATQELSARLDRARQAAERLPVAADRETATALRRAATDTLQAGDLRQALHFADGLDRHVNGRRDALLTRLDGDRQSLLVRARRAGMSPREERDLATALARSRDRADAGLAADITPLVRWVEALESDALARLAVLFVAEDDEAVPALFWETGIAAEPRRVGRVPAKGAAPGRLLLRDVDGHLDKLPGRRERLLPVVRVRGRAEEVPEVPEWLKATSGRFFVEADDAVHGPYAVRDGVVGPNDPRGLVATLDREAFWSLFGRLELPGQRPAEAHVLEPPTLEHLLAEGGQVLDRLDADQLRGWLTTFLDGLDGVSPDALESAINRLHAMDLPPRVLADRLATLTPVLAAARQLASARDAAVATFLASPDGEAAIDAAARAIVAERADLLDEVARQEQARLEQALHDLQGQEARARQALTHLKQEVAAAEGLAEDARFRLLARWGLDAPGARAEARSEVRLATRVPQAPADAESPASLAELAEDVANALELPAAEAANLLLTVATGWWTLLAGPPGVGKSTRVRRLLHRLGHGPRDGRYLELVVRRDWHDDAALFGFWHPGTQRWEASSEGLVERLLVASEAARRQDGGLYAVVLEELNLASPEHYLARPISALEDEAPTLRLYGRDVVPANAHVYPAQFPVHDNVRWLGTVNVDDTTERLSPRFLSRASVLWVEPDPRTLLRGALPSLPVPRPVRWDAVTRLAAVAPPVDLGPIAPLVELLHDEAVPGAPTPRALAGIRRYLAAAQGVMDTRDAMDFQVLQRVLPSLRGVGHRYRALFDRLADLATQRGWHRSAARLRRVRVRGEEAGDYYDVFHGGL